MAGNVANLRPSWNKGGPSPNPGGLNKETVWNIRDTRERAAKYSPEAMDFLLAVMRDVGQKMPERLRAAENILDRAGIKAVAIDVQSTETDAEGGVKTMRVEFVTPNAG